MATQSKTKIIYCSRTHSQVAQMVKSLKKTPYRPRMAILGSRDRMCIHRDLRPRNIVQGGGRDQKWRATASQVNVGCRMRTNNTEKVNFNWRTKIKTHFSFFMRYHFPLHRSNDFRITKITFLRNGSTEKVCFVIRVMMMIPQ